MTTVQSTKLILQPIADDTNVLVLCLRALGIFILCQARPRCFTSAAKGILDIFRTRKPHIEIAIEE